MNLFQQPAYKYEIFIEGAIETTSYAMIFSSRQLSDDNGRRVMRSLLIAIPTLLMVSFGTWAFLVLVVLEH
jgi:hypothetical protein